MDNGSKDDGYKGYETHAFKSKYDLVVTCINNLDYIINKAESCPIFQYF